MKDSMDNSSRLKGLLQSAAKSEAAVGDRAISRAMARVRQESPQPRSAGRTIFLSPLRQAALVAAMALVIGAGVIGWNLQWTPTQEPLEVASIPGREVVKGQEVEARYVLGEIGSLDPANIVSFDSLHEAITKVKKEGTILVGPGEIRGPIRIDVPLTLAALDKSAVRMLQNTQVSW